MRKALLVLATAALMTGSALIVPATARDRSDRGEMTANQIVDQAAAQTARMKVELRLTLAQANNWPGFETAMQDMSKKRADRQIAMRNERKQATGPVDALEQIGKSADSRIERANDWKKLADAAKPLSASLDEQQKRRFAESLFRGDRGGGDRDRDRERESN